MRAIPSLSCLILLAACGEFPTAGEPSGRAGYPDLLPLSGLLEGLPPQDGAVATPDATDDADALLRARAASLLARAEDLRNASP